MRSHAAVAAGDGLRPAVPPFGSRFLKGGCLTYSLSFGSIALGQWIRVLFRPGTVGVPWDLFVPFGVFLPKSILPKFC